MTMMASILSQQPLSVKPFIDENKISCQMIMYANVCELVISSSEI